MYRLNVFLTSALVEGEWSASRPGRFTLGKRASSTHWIGGWVGLRAGLDGMEKWKFLTLLELELRPLGRPIRSQSLYRLRYPDSMVRLRNHELERVRREAVVTYFEILSRHLPVETKENHESLRSR
jgi:hypothetical protein